MPFQVGRSQLAEGGLPELSLADFGRVFAAANGRSNLQRLLSRSGGAQIRVATNRDAPDAASDSALLYKTTSATPKNPECKSSDSIVTDKADLRRFYCEHYRGNDDDTWHDTAIVLLK